MQMRLKQMTVAAAMTGVAMFHGGTQVNGAAVPGEILVLPGNDKAVEVQATLNRQGLNILEIDTYSGVMRVAVPAGQEANWIATLASDDAIAYAEPNGIGSGGGGTNGLGGITPDDTHFGSQWHLVNTGQTGGAAGADIEADLAWTLETGSSDVVIAVLDTGIDSDHPEFAGRIDPDGFDFVNEDSNPEADHPHGTWVAGCIAANANNQFAVTGVGWNCQILPLKVLNSNNGGNTFDLAQALNYAVTQDDVQIICMSLINYPGNSTLLNALANASAAGKILMACAGNGGIGNADVSYPGASPLTISIGATTHTDARASFSGTGAALDFVAPGQNIVTANHGTFSDSFATVSGCSFATPITSGVAGLLISKAADAGISLDQQDIYELLVAGAEDQVGGDPPGRDDFMGHGRVNAYQSLLAVSDLGCLGDGDGSGSVDTTDLLGMLGAWGTAASAYDIAPPGGDGTVDIADLLLLLTLWGPCPL